MTAPAPTEELPPLADVLLAGRIRGDLNRLVEQKAGPLGLKTSADIVRAMAADWVGRPELAAARGRGERTRKAAK